MDSRTGDYPDFKLRSFHSKGNFTQDCIFTFNVTTVQKCLFYLIVLFEFSDMPCDSNVYSLKGLIEGFAKREYG